MATERILVVEDEAVTGLDIQQSLRRKGYDVLGVATTGAEAISIARACQPALVLMDIRLTGDIDGIEAAQKIKAELNIPVVFLTAFADQATLHRAKSAEPCAYLLKPFEETVLATTIEIALNKHRLHEKTIRKAEQALRVSEARFYHLAENVSHHAVQLLDPTGQILSWNPSSEEVHGWEAGEVLGKNCSILYPGEDIAKNKPCQDLEAAARAGRYEEYGRQLRKDNSGFPSELILIALRDQESRIAGFLRITRPVPPGVIHN